MGIVITPLEDRTVLPFSAAVPRTQFSRSQNHEQPCGLRFWNTLSAARLDHRFASRSFPMLRWSPTRGLATRPSENASWPDTGTNMWTLEKSDDNRCDPSPNSHKSRTALRIATFTTTHALGRQSRATNVEVNWEIVATKQCAHATGETRPPRRKDRIRAIP